jgi:hypothetical protein
VCSFSNFHGDIQITCTNKITSSETVGGTYRSLIVHKLRATFKLKAHNPKGAQARDKKIPSKVWSSFKLQSVCVLATAFEIKPSHLGLAESPLCARGGVF